MHKNNFKVNDGEEIELEDDSQEILVKDIKGPSKLTFQLADEASSKTSAEAPLSSATNFEKMSEITKQAEKTASAMVVTAESLLDMIEFTKALTQYDSGAEAPTTSSTDAIIGMRPDRSTESCACVCHPDDTDSHDGDYEGDCRCKAPSHANLKGKKTPGSGTAKTTSATEEKTSIVIETVRSSSDPGEEPIIVVAHPPESRMGPIALYPNHECSAQCHCYLRHIPQGPPLENASSAGKESHGTKPKKCSSQCRCSCHKEPVTVVECNHQCLLHCGPAPEPEQEQDKEEASEQPVLDIETNPTAAVPSTDSEDSKRRSSLRESIAKLGSKFKPASMAKGSASAGVPPEEEENAVIKPGSQFRGSTSAGVPPGSQFRSASTVQGSMSGAVPFGVEAPPEPTTDEGEPSGEKRGTRSSGKGSIFSRLSKGIRGSK